MSRSVTVISPGRVNLIGEHIDYNGFGVLPCAIGRFVRVKVTEIEGPHRLVCIQLEDPAKFTMKQFSELPTIDAQKRHWTDYVLAIIAGLQARFPAELADKKIKVEVSGNIPIAAGLSSSSALVVGVALAVNDLFCLGLDRHALAELCIAFEKLAGTSGGGMDQACILLAQKNEALSIEFEPRLTARPVKVPGRFIAAHCLVEAAKAVDAATKFNRRVLECKIAAQSLGCVNLKEASVKWSEEEIKAKIESEIPETCTFADSTGLDQMMQAAAENASKFKPRARARHVINEALRVGQFIKAADSGDLVEMGRLMDASDLSCQIDYECSCPELSELTECFRKARALGSRLTGAGWGGFAIALVHDADASRVMQFIRTHFYAPRGVHDCASLLFEFEPETGAHVVP